MMLSIEKILLSTATNSTGVLNLPALTTSAGGINFGGDFYLYRSASTGATLTGSLTVTSFVKAVHGTEATLQLEKTGTNANTSYFSTQGNVVALYDGTNSRFVWNYNVTGNTFTITPATTITGVATLTAGFMASANSSIITGGGGSTTLGLQNTTATTGKTWALQSHGPSGNFYITHTAVIDALIISHTTGNANFQSTTDATTGGAGAIMTSGGVYAAKKIIGNGGLQASAVTFLQLNNSDNSNGLTLNNSGGASVGRLTITTTGTSNGVTIASTTATNAVTTGALVVNGGVGIAKELYVGGIVSVLPTIATGTYALYVAGASGAARDVFLAGVVTVSNGFTVRYDNVKMLYDFAGTTSITTIASTVDSTAATNGGLVVSGGVGIAKKLYVGGGEINLTHATSNIIGFNQVGSAAPSFTTRSAGTKIVLWAGLSPTAVDYAIGLDTATIWFSVPTNVTTTYYKWYGGTTEVARMDATGRMSLGTGTITGQLNLVSGTTAANGMYFGTDVNLYRSAADMLKTDDNMTVVGNFFAATKSFLIPHPTKVGKNLRYACLEGPENGVYVRGKTTLNIIELPDYWPALVDESTITVNLTPNGSIQELYVEKIEDNKVYIASTSMFMNYNYMISAERKDVDKLVTEIDA